jgi:hypothetical protein
LLRRVTRGAVGLPHRLLLFPKREDSARTGRAGRQCSIHNAPCIGAVYLLDQRAARIPGNCRDRPFARPEAKAMQRKGGFEFRVTCHADLLENRTETASHDATVCETAAPILS